jgi:hypothetical protein
MSAIGWLVRAGWLGALASGAMASVTNPVPAGDALHAVAAPSAVAVANDGAGVAATGTPPPGAGTTATEAPSGATGPACCCSARVSSPRPRPPAPPLELRVEAACTPPAGEARPTNPLLDDAHAQLLLARAELLRAEAEAMRRASQRDVSKAPPKTEPQPDKVLAGAVAAVLLALGLVAGAASFARNGMASASTLRHWGGFGGEARANVLDRPLVIGVLALVLLACAGTLAWALWPPVAGAASSQ